MKKLIQILPFFILGAVLAQNGQFKSELFIQNQDTLPYRILYPLHFDTQKKYPVVLFLHGSGERGKDNSKQLVHGKALFQSARNLEQFPAIIIFPQCPEEDYWAHVDINRDTHPFTIKFPENVPATKSLQNVIDLIQNISKESFIDKSRIYVGGLSMGGMGTYEILYRMPNTFAAAFVICGGGNTKLAQQYAQQTPLWIFHGAKDDIVDPQLALQMATALLKYGAKPNVTIYAQDNHNSWDSTFQEPHLLPWLFSHYQTIK